MDYDLRPLKPDDYRGHDPMTLKACDDLLVKYARKALDFEVNYCANYSDGLC